MSLSKEFEPHFILIRLAFTMNLQSSMLMPRAMRKRTPTSVGVKTVQRPARKPCLVSVRWAFDGRHAPKTVDHTLYKLMIPMLIVICSSSYSYTYIMQTSLATAYLYSMRSTVLVMFSRWWYKTPAAWSRCLQLRLLLSCRNL